MAEPAIPPAASPAAVAPGLPAGSGKKSSYKLLIVVGAIVLVVVVFVMLFMRNRSRKLREELERQRRQEMHNQSELEAQRIAEAYYAQSYPAGLYYDQQQQQPNQTQQQPDATAPVHPPTSAVPAAMPDAAVAGHCVDGVCYPPKQVPKPQPAMPPAPSAPRQNLVPSPAGTVRELPDEPGSPSPRPPVHQQQSIPPPVVDPFLTPVEQPVKPASPQPPPVRSPMLQQSFRIDPIVSNDPFAPIVPPIPAELETPPTISLETAADDDQPPPLVETGLTMD
jgi:FtsZ-interacting cell division protein ZipA